MKRFPLRIKLKHIKTFDPPIDFKSLILKLQFIKNKKRWAGHLMCKAMRVIPKEDFELIIKKIKR